MSHMKKPDGIHMLITHPQLKGGEPGFARKMQLYKRLSCQVTSAVRLVLIFRFASLQQPSYLLNAITSMHVRHP
eukprot:363511-Chlamydomonas_euryale.AAC.8